MPARPHKEVADGKTEVMEKSIELFRYVKSLKTIQDTGEWQNGFVDS